MRGDPLLPDVFYQVIETPFVRHPDLEIISVSTICQEDWRAKIIAYLREHYHPADPSEESRLTYRCRQYTIIEDNLYMQGIVQPLLKCIARREGKELVAKVHQGFFGCHVGPRALASKILRLDFFWPGIIRDAQVTPQNCEAYQMFTPTKRGPSQKSKLIAPT